MHGSFGQYRIGISLGAVILFSIIKGLQGFNLLKCLDYDIIKLMGLFRAKIQKNQENPCFREKSEQSGSAIVWILVMVALLATLYFVVSSGFRSRTNKFRQRKS